MLADQMEMHNNPALVDVFRDLARAEGIHRDQICRMAGDIDVAAHAHKVARWRIGESPESADLGAAQYQMTPHDALQMALAAEQGHWSSSGNCWQRQRMPTSGTSPRSWSRKKPGTSRCAIVCCCAIRHRPVADRPGIPIRRSRRLRGMEVFMGMDGCGRARLTAGAEGLPP